MAANVLNVRIGFIGLGTMGGPMSQRLVAAGYHVVVFDLSAAAIDNAVERGAHPAENALAIGRDSQVVFLSLPNSDHVEEAVLGPQGCAQALRMGSVVIDLSSARPASTRMIAAALQEHGLGFLDAPVSRGVPAAQAGTLSMMVGGDPVTFEQCEPLLKVLASDICYVGPAGTGHAIKALNNLLAATNLVAALEVILLGKRVGLDPKTLLEIVNASSGRSTMTEDRLPKYVLPRTFNSRFSLGLMYKDVKTAVELAHQHDAPLVIADWTRQVYALAMASDMGQADNQEISVFMEHLLGESLDGSR